MYLKEKLIKVLKIKNVLLTAAVVFFLIVDVYAVTSLIGYYWGDWDTVLHARATSDVIHSLPFELAGLTIALFSRFLIGDACFYSAYFEGDLDGYISYADLAEVTGKSPAAVARRLHLLRKLYMRAFTFRKENGKEIIVLDSKECACECRSCGAVIEKRMYFTGVCKYCGSSDLFAKVLTGERFYSISNTVASGVRKPDYYASKRLEAKKGFFYILLILGILVIVLGGSMAFDNLSKYDDKEYLKEVLLSGKSYSSFELIKKEIMMDVIMGFVLVAAMIPVVISRIIRLRYVSAAQISAVRFAQSNVPFIKASELPAELHKKSPKRIKLVRGSIRRGYLQHSSIEKHEVLEVALAKQIVKDTCPSCGASIVGAVHSDYTCKYCGSRIMDVVKKK